MLAFLSCQSQNQPGGRGIVGKWKLIMIEYNDGFIEKATEADKVFLTFHNDGTYINEYDNEVEEGTYILKEQTLIMEGEHGGEYIIKELTGTTLVFGEDFSREEACEFTYQRVY